MIKKSAGQLTVIDYVNLAAISSYLRFPSSIFVHSILILSEFYFCCSTCFWSGFLSGFSTSQNQTRSKTIAKNKTSANLIDLSGRCPSRFPSRLELRDFRLPLKIFLEYFGLKIFNSCVQSGQFNCPF